MKSVAHHQTQTVPVAAAARLGVGKRLMGFLLYPAAANSSVEFKDAATDTGTALLTASTLANQSLFVDLSDFGGLEFSTAIFCKPAGVGSIVYCWFQ
jgi:hypothetical protein